LEEALAVEHAEVAEVERVGAMSCYTHRPRAVPQERTTMKLGQLAVVVLMMVFLLAGCGGGKPVVIENREVFDAAVEQYLRSKSMELVISEYISFEMDEPGAAATAVIALKHAGEGVAPVQTRYEFSFEKINDRWQVASARKAR
jgi:hypothetical protein